MRPSHRFVPCGAVLSWAVLAHVMGCATVKAGAQAPTAPAETVVAAPAATAPGMSPRGVGGEPAAAAAREPTGGGASPKSAGGGEPVSAIVDRVEQPAPVVAAPKAAAAAPSVAEATPVPMRDGPAPVAALQRYVPPLRCEAAVAGRAQGSWRHASLEVPGAGDRPAFVPVSYYLPAQYAEGSRYPLIVVLHGWDHAPRHIEEQSNLASLADELHAVLVVPSVGKTVYEKEFYGKGARWGPSPGSALIGRTVLDWARAQLPVRREVEATALVGYSTGGRGAMVVGQQHPGRFGFLGSTSGTYALDRLDEKSGEYRIHERVLGSRRPMESESLKRWRENDVAVDAHAAALRGVTLFIAHGGADPVVPFDQFEVAADYLNRHGLDYGYCVVKEARHDFAFWNASFTSMFRALGRRWGPDPVVADPAAPKRTALPDTLKVAPARTGGR